MIKICVYLPIHQTKKGTDSFHLNSPVDVCIYIYFISTLSTCEITNCYVIILQLRKIRNMKIKTRAGEEACSWHTKTKKQCGIRLGQPRLVSKMLGNFPTENKQQKSLITHFWKCIAIDERGLSNANVLMPSRAAVWVPQ